jgi:hypothetical protein
MPVWRDAIWGRRLGWEIHLRLIVGCSERLVLTNPHRQGSQTGEPTQLHRLDRELGTMTIVEFCLSPSYSMFIARR